MANIFICVENPASVIGEKQKNFRPSKKGQKPKKISPDKKNQWTLRQTFLEDDQIDIDATVDSSRELETRYIRELSAVNKNKNIHWASTGSLPTMFVELRHAAETNKIQFDTIVFVGHGSAGGMSTGTGTLPDLPDDLTKTKLKKLKRHAEAYDQGKRVITERNAQRWGNEFGQVKDCLATGEKSRLHIFLLGCSTGLPYNNTTLQQTVATTVRQQCNLNVAAYGTDSDIKIGQTQEIVESLVTIEKAATDSGTYQLKTSPTHLLCSFS